MKDYNDLSQTERLALIEANVELFHRQLERHSGKQEEINFEPPYRHEVYDPIVLYTYTPIKSLLPPE